jgi:hypothetical protein
MRRHGIALVVVALAASLLGQGCSREIRDPTTGVEADYDWGVLKACLDRPIADVYQAAQQAVCELGLDVYLRAQDGISAGIVAVDAQAEQVEIWLGALPGSRTELCIRIGLWGDKNKSIVLFESILARPAESVSAAAVPYTPQSTRPVSPSRPRSW